MDNWTISDINNVYGIVVDLLRLSVGSDSARKIAETITLEVAKNISETADKSFNDDDVRLAMGRVLVKRLGILLGD